jgi:hypothetical protein
MRKQILALVGSVIFAGSAYTMAGNISPAYAAQTFAPPLVQGYEIDRCLFSPRYGGGDFCNDVSTQELANYFCQQQGYSKSTYWSTHWFGGEGITDMTLREIGQNGQLVKRWQTQNGGANRFRQIDCE